VNSSSPWIWSPPPGWVEETNVFRFMRKLGCATREEFLDFSTRELERFWDAMVKEVGIEWFRPYTQVLDTSRGVEWSRWFEGGELNIAWNCVDRHAANGASARAACIWEAEDGASRTLTFAELAALTNRIANAMKGHGLQQGDRVAICMPMLPEVAAVLYACLKIGLMVVPIFSGFGEGAIAARLENSGARLVFTADFAERRGKRLPLKSKIDEALARPNAVEKVVVYPYKGGGFPRAAGRDLTWDEFLEGHSVQCASLPLASETPGLLLYTSGTTGRPKGTVHTHAGALATISKEVYLSFDHKPEDRFFWLSDIGWMMGPWMLIGNHHFGGTVFLYDGAPDFPNANRMWEMIERHGITAFGISPTAIRLLMRHSQPERFPLTSLRLLGSTGEPWDDTSYLWFFERAGKGRCPVINISGGTELVGALLTPLPIQPLKPSTLGGPAPGVATEVVDDEGKPVRGKMGHLVATKPCPSMTRGIWGDPERYLRTYWSRWPGIWNHGDWASVDEDGCWFLHGRSDESMNVSGRKVGPAEVEESLMEHSAVAEAAVIGAPDPVKGEAIVCFVVLKPGRECSEKLLEEISDQAGHSLGSAFRPREVHIVPELPKTQSGKIVRRLIRQQYLGEELGDLSTVENPRALEAFRTPSPPADCS
jgi:acetyl-CoA synthetase